MKSPIYLLASLLFGTATCGDGVRPPLIQESAVPVSTTLTVPPEGIRSVDRSAFAMEDCESLFHYRPQFKEEILARGTEEWQQGENLFLQTISSPHSHSPQYAFIFLHGAAEIVPQPAEVAIVKKLLEELGGGLAAFPQALPKFDYTIYCPRSEGDQIKFPGEQDPNAVCFPVYPAWLPPLPASGIHECYAKPEAYVMKAWLPFFKEYVERIKKIVLGFHHEHGVPLGKIYLLGFSQGAVMAQHALLSLAAEGIRIGGGVGYDGSDVEMMASKETLAKLSAPPPEILYFLYSGGWDRVAPHAECLTQFPGINVQLYAKTRDEKPRIHGVYLPLVEPTKLWIQARDKQSAAPAVRAAWSEALAQIPVQPD